MAGRPLVSIVVPCYQSERTLDQTLRSVARQSIRNWECMIVDDGSTDSSLRIADQWHTRDSRFRVLEKENGGPSSARNAGVSRSVGPFLSFLDSDDCLYRQALATFLRAADEDKRADVYYCDFDIINEGGHCVTTTRCPDSIEFEPLCRANAFAPHAAIVRRSALWDSAPFDESIFGCEDWDFWLTLARRGSQFTKVDKTLVAYRRHDGTEGQNLSQNLLGMFHATISVLKKHILTIDSDQEDRPTEQRLAAATANGIAVEHLLLYLGWALSYDDGSLFEDVLAESRANLPRRPLENASPDTFIYGLLVGLGQPYKHGIRDFASRYDFCRILSPLMRVEHELSLPGFSDGVLRRALRDYRRLTQEHDNLKTSRSFRVARTALGAGAALRRLTSDWLFHRKPSLDDAVQGSCSPKR